MGRGRWRLTPERLSDEDLDETMAIAGADLMTYLRSTVDPAETLLAIMTLPSSADATPAGDVCQFDMLGRRVAEADAVSIIMARILSREVDRELRDASKKQVSDDCGEALRLVEHALKLAVRAVGDAESTDAATGAVRLAALALDLDLVRDLVRHLVYAHDACLTEDFGEQDLERAVDLASTLDLGRQPVGCDGRFDRAVAITVGIARALALRLINELDAIEVDASQADISRISLEDLGVLAGVVWTSLTVWPPNVQEQIRSRSQQVSPGVYRVQKVLRPVDRDLTNA